MTETTTKVTSTQTIIVVSIVLGAILALIRASVVLANANAGPDVTSALVLTTPVLTFFFSDVSYRTLFVSRGEQRTSRKRDESSGDFIRIR